MTNSERAKKIWRDKLRHRKRFGQSEGWFPIESSTELLMRNSLKILRRLAGERETGPHANRHQCPAWRNRELERRMRALIAAAAANMLRAQAP
jgi:hypothetical protein